MAATIFVVSDHEGIRTALQQWLEVEFPQYHVNGLSSDAGALAHIYFQTPDLVIMATGFSGHKDMAAMRQFNALVPQVPVVILTFFDDEEHRTEAIHAGAAAFIGTGKMYEELIPQLETLLSRIHA